MTDSRRIRRILIANRGEIAVRVIRACRDLDLESVAVYSDADREALHVRFADAAFRLGPAPAPESYLAIDRILDAASAAGADAIHPGYGFLAENADFADACRDAGLIFIGPSPETMRLVGDKVAARAAAIAAGVPTIPGSPEPVEDTDEAARWGDDLGYPVMLKAAAGGGGKGMRQVYGADELASAFRAARSEATSAFGDGRVYVEKVIVEPRHVEVQILADLHGNRIHLGERECSLQRRHQKVLEEAPSPIVTPELRARMGQAALAMAEASGYTNAGTVEFLVDAARNFYFMEVNARLQVEHPVTEMLTGMDLVASQIALAEGVRLPWKQSEVALSGHAMECRIYAEDPARGFEPSPGTVEILRIPGGPGVRDDSCLFKGYEVPIHYDPLVAKLVTWGPNRDSAIRRMRRALEEYKIGGIATTIPLFLRVLDDPTFHVGEFTTAYLDRLLEDDVAGAGIVEPGGEGDGEPQRPEPEVEISDGEAEIREVAQLATALHAYLTEEARSLASELSAKCPECDHQMEPELEQLRFFSLPQSCV